eukprot:scaffold22521_cov49-Phaeocystis_antarctica.AAC.3
MLGFECRRAVVQEPRARDSAAQRHSSSSGKAHRAGAARPGSSKPASTIRTPQGRSRGGRGLPTYHPGRLQTPSKTSIDHKAGFRARRRGRGTEPRGVGRSRKMTATTFACSTVASSSANSAAHRYDPGARPSSSNWTDYVVSLYDPTVDNENQEPEPEICLILGDAAASLERGPKDPTTQRFTDVSGTVPRSKECDSRGEDSAGILKLGAEVLGVPRPVPNRPTSPD